MKIRLRDKTAALLGYFYLKGDSARTDRRIPLTRMPPGSCAVFSSTSLQLLRCEPAALVQLMTHPTPSVRRTAAEILAAQLQSSNPAVRCGAYNQLIHSDYRRYIILLISVFLESGIRELQAPVEKAQRLLVCKPRLNREEILWNYGVVTRMLKTIIRTP